MTQSASSLLAILLGLGVFAVIMAIGWRSVQNRRILRFQNASGKETIIVAGESDEIRSVTTADTKRPPATPAPPQVVVNAGAAEPAPAPELSRGAAGSRSAADVEADASGRDRLDRMVSANK